jgi:peroxiredoxin
MIISLIACNSTPPHSFKLEGSVEGAKDSENIILYYFLLNNGEWQEIADTTKIINGKFLFKGNIDELTAAELCFDDPNVVISARIYLEPTIMKLRIDKNQPYAYELSGTKVEKENVELRKELESDAKIYHKNLEYINDLFTQIQLNDNNSPVRDSLYIKLDQRDRSIAPKMNNTRLNFILKHNSYRIVPDLLYLLANDEDIPIATLKSIYNSLPEQSKVSLMGKLACKKINYEESIRKREENALVGTTAPDFAIKDTSGKTIRLSEFRNKNFILLDFWASWCSPCIKEIPQMKNLYEKYSKTELKIIGISLDTDSNKWHNAINKYKLDQWSQILNIQNENKSVFDINNEDLGFLYNVNAIPYCILIDKQGKIIARWEYFGEEQLIEIDRILNNTK